MKNDEYKVKKLKYIFLNKHFTNLTHKQNNKRINKNNYAPQTKRTFKLGNKQ